MKEEHSEYYEEHYVAFIDLLGFSELIRASETDPRKFQGLRQVFFEFGRFAQLLEENEQAIVGVEHVIPDLRGKGLLPPRMVGFSDSIVFSWKRHKPPGPIDTLPFTVNVARFCARLLSFGIPTRGGISAGLLFHEGSVVFGPALVEAYRLESKAAKYPRIVLANELVSEFKTCPNPMTRTHTVLQQDADSLHFLDILAPPSPVREIEAAHFHNIRRALVGMYNAAPHIGALANIGWYISYFNKTIRDFKDLGIESIASTELTRTAS